MRFLLLMLWLGSSLTIFAQSKPAYQLYQANGKKVSYKKMIRSISKADVVLFGELHNNAIAHWLQVEVTKDLAAEQLLVLGAEMMETDNQAPLDLYLADSIDYKALDTLARLWPNYKTDYAPLVDWARQNNRPFIATNIPRRYARLVHRHDFAALDTLPESEKQWIAPLPIPFDISLPQYQKILEMMGDHGSPELVKAQAIKDATMAHRIVQNLQDNVLFLHFNGAFHSDFYEGIVWYLSQYSPALSVATISTVTQSNLKTLDPAYHGKADFVICVDEDVTTTY